MEDDREKKEEEKREKIPLAKERTTENEEDERIIGVEMLIFII